MAKFVEMEADVKITMFASVDENKKPEPVMAQETEEE